MPGPKDRRSLVSEGTGTAHQCFGADSSAPSNSTFTKERKYQHILVRTDNTTAKSYINHIGETYSPTLNAIALSIWNWCL